MKQLLTILVLLIASCNSKPHASYRPHKPEPLYQSKPTIDRVVKDNGNYLHFDSIRVSAAYLRELDSLAKSKK